MVTERIIFFIIGYISGSAAVFLIFKRKIKVVAVIREKDIAKEEFIPTGNETECTIISSPVAEESMKTFKSEMKNTYK